MRRTVLLTLLLAVVATASYADWSEAEEIKEVTRRVEYIYQHVGKMTEAEMDKRFCTKQYLKLNKRFQKKCRKQGEVIRDYDHWLMGQEYDKDFRITIDSVSIPGELKFAIVKLTVHNFEDQRVTLQVLYERGNWFINDFTRHQDNIEPGGYEDTEIDIMFNYVEGIQMEPEDVKRDEP